ncbi:DNA gyrase inhibitor YacG [Acinetobacter larvae]|uniref:DNA gyrase inhibitor YacG n=1 Tax=Acinetobacter larvae TaxID=1789224 RepID=A0A1B2LWF1_9GAMM|nr:DNA gyrase inhibitor YacG [Acinetobacter larvae]AOA57219.1 DNA gyrase inhibitor YacG [Acinetobacter larvae]
MPTVIQCPHCAEKTTWQDNPYRPFCSERCKLIDFGAWANAAYKLPTQDSPQHDPSSDE